MVPSKAIRPHSNKQQPTTRAAIYLSIGQPRLHVIPICENKELQLLFSRKKLFRPISVVVRKNRSRPIGVVAPSHVQCFFLKLVARPT